MRAIRSALAAILATTRACRSGSSPYRSKSCAEVTMASFAPDGQSIVTASRDHTVRVWDARTGAELRRLVAHGAPVWGALYTPDGQYIVSAGDDVRGRTKGADQIRKEHHTGGEVGIGDVEVKRVSEWLNPLNPSR